MYFWNIGELVEKLKTQTLSTYVQAQYYLALMLLTSLSVLTQQLFRPPVMLSTQQIVFTWLSGVLVLLGGVMYCYKINKGGDDRDFLTRMVCLTFTGSIRFGILSLMVILPVAIVLGIIIGLYLSPETILANQATANIFGSVFGLLWAVGLYWYIGRQFKQVAY